LGFHGRFPDGFFFDFRVDLIHFFFIPQAPAQRADSFWLPFKSFHLFFSWAHLSWSSFPFFLSPVPFYHHCSPPGPVSFLPPWPVPFADAGSLRNARVLPYFLTSSFAFVKRDFGALSFCGRFFLPYFEGSVPVFCIIWAQCFHLSAQFYSSCFGLPPLEVLLACCLCFRAFGYTSIPPSPGPPLVQSSSVQEFIFFFEVESRSQTWFFSREA